MIFESHSKTVSYTHLDVYKRQAHAKLNEHGADIVTSGVLDFGEDAEGRARFGHFDISFERSRKSEYEIIGTKGWVKCHAAWVFQNDVPVISWALEDGRFAEERFAPSNHFTLETVSYTHLDVYKRQRL